MAFNWQGFGRGAAQGVADAAGVQVSVEVEKQREARMAQYRQVQVADERAYQGQVAQQSAQNELVKQGQQAQIEAAQLAEQRAYDEGRDEVTSARDQANELEQIRLKGELDPRANNTTVNVDNGQDLDARTEEFSKAIGKADADRYTEVRNAAANAAQLEDTVNVLEDISSKFETGKTNEALATLGQYVGTDAGAALQTWEATANSLVLDKASQLSGVLSDKDIDILKSTAPRFGNDPRANAVTIDLLKKGIIRSRENEASLQEHINKYGNLNNWKAPNSQGTTVRPRTNAADNAGDVVSGFQAWKKNR